MIYLNKKESIFLNKIKADIYRDESLIKKLEILKV